MFVFSVKTGYKQIFSVLGCLAVVIVAAVLSLTMPARPAVSTGARVSGSEERLAYLRAQGLEVVADSEQVREVRIPDEPDEVLLQYEQLQQQVGRSLEPYYGKRVRLYTYDVTNTGGEQITAHVYVYHDRVIAGDVEDAAGGEMVALG